jgi:hypothetical protein
MKAIPYGTIDCKKLAPLFKPRRHQVSMVYYLVRLKGFQMGFTTHCGVHKKVVGFRFSPPVGPIEWKAGNIDFGDKTLRRFEEVFEKVYGVKPKMR